MRVARSRGRAGHGKLLAADGRRWSTAFRRSRAAGADRQKPGLQPEARRTSPDLADGHPAAAVVDLVRPGVVDRDRLAGHRDRGPDPAPGRPRPDLVAVRLVRLPEPVRPPRRPGP